MQEFEGKDIELGDEPPLITDGRRGPPDRREISARWLTGTFLTGITSSILMGVALLAALNGREQLATPPELLAHDDIQLPDAENDILKGDRVTTTTIKQKNRDRRRFDLSIRQKIGEREVLRTRPFEYVRMVLAIDHPTTKKYPEFNALTIFSEGVPSAQNTNTSQIYGAKIENEVNLRMVNLPLMTEQFDSTNDLTTDEVEEVVRNAGMFLTDGGIQVASLHYIDPLRFGNGKTSLSLTTPFDVRITQENVSIAPRTGQDAVSNGFSEEVLPFHTDNDILNMLNNAGYDSDNATNIAETLTKLMNSPRLKAGSVLRIGVESHNDKDHIVRASIYNGMTHLVTIALNNHAQYVPAHEPEITPLLQTAFDDSTPQPRMHSKSSLLTVYDGIYHAALAYGMSNAMIQQLIRILAWEDVDLQARLTSTDQIEAFFSLPENSDHVDSDSEILYVTATFNGITRKFYRFQSPDNGVDYFDENGKSVKQFLIRTPVPNGIFRSPFGMRRHPILHYLRRHTGVDWAAPRGAAIIATGDGVVESAGRTTGYGNQIIIRHANGYATSYSHQNAIASGIIPGTHVRQGQVIGYVGSTGLSTGPHLHYELIVNNTKVDPMRVRLPANKTLKGKDLQAFQVERLRIDQLLNDQKDNKTKIAATTTLNN